MSSNRSKQRAIAVMRERLHRAFPLAIMGKGKLKKPLKVGIHSDILARMPDVTEIQVKRALRDYVQGPKYLGQCVEGAWRFDLDGEPVAQIDAEAAIHCAGRLAGLQKLWSKGRQKRMPAVKPVARDLGAAA